MNYRQQVSKIVAQCRKIGWPVEMSDRGQSWLYRISMPNGERVQIHSSPSDTNWAHVVARQLEAGGFAAALSTWEEKDKKDKSERLEADRIRNDAKAKEVAKRSEALAKAAGPYAVREADVGWLTKPTEFPETRTVIITPQVAKQVLEHNTHNRRLRPTRVAFLASIIQKGDWSCTHQGGAVGSDGVLQDGQHRLNAIVEANQPVQMLWSVGMPPENFKKIDTGLVRSAKDVVHMRGEANAAQLAATAKVVFQFREHGKKTHLLYRATPASNDDIDAVMEEIGDELNTAVYQAKQIRREFRINIAGAAAAIYLITARLPEGDERVEQFFEDLETGAIPNGNDPVRLLRRVLIRAAEQSKLGYNAFETLALVIKAWNHRAKGKDMKILVWKSKVEDFPTIFLPPPPGSAAERMAVYANDDDDEDMADQQELELVG